MSKGRLFINCYPAGKYGMEMQAKRLGREHLYLPGSFSYEEIENNKSQYRAGLIELGNWGRSQSPDYWLHKILEVKGKIMVTDVRVPHEYEVFKNAGALSVRIEASRETRMQRGTLIGEDDITEIGLDNIKDWDFVIENNSSYEDFKTKVLELKKCL